MFMLRSITRNKNRSLSDTIAIKIWLSEKKYNHAETLYTNSVKHEHSQWLLSMFLNQITNEDGCN